MNSMAGTIFLGWIPIAIIVFLLVWCKHIYDKHIGSKNIVGEPEFPRHLTIVAKDLGAKLSPSIDKNSITITIGKPCYKPTEEENMNFLKTALYDSWYSKGLNYEYEITNYRDDGQEFKVDILLSSHQLHDIGFIKKEIKNIGNILDPMHASESVINELITDNGKLYVKIGRTQFTRNLENIKMSEEHISENIKNRLYRQYDVVCRELDDEIFKAQLIRI